MAWLINRDGEAVKLDLAQRAFVRTTSLPIGDLLLEGLAADTVRENLFVPHGRGPYAVAVFDLKTLASKGKLDFKVDHAPGGDPPAIRFVFPPTGGVVYARWWNDAAAGGAGAFEIVTIDASTFRTTARQVTSPLLADKLMLDPSGGQLYSMSLRAPARIDVFDVPGFARTSTIDLEPLLSQTAFGRSIHDSGQGKVLINENEKTLRNDPNRFILSVFEVGSRRLLPRIPTGSEGRGTLLPRTNRALFDEQTLLTPGLGAIQPGVDLLSVGRVHVYDTVAGTRLTTVRIPTDRLGRILGVSPAEDIFCYQSFDPGDPTPKISIVNLATFSIVKTLTQPIDGPEAMVIFDE